VRDVAILFDAMVGYDPADAASINIAYAIAHRYAGDLARASLKGVRVAVLHPEMPDLLKTKYEAALAVLKAQGAVLVDVE
ncbi:hypothetical protein ABTD78_24525, partial [Acinetobacter baumannii]